VTRNLLICFFFCCCESQALIIRLWIGDTELSASRRSFLGSFLFFEFKSLAASLRRNVYSPPREFTSIDRRYFIGLLSWRTPCFYSPLLGSGMLAFELWIDFFAALESFLN